MLARCELCGVGEHDVVLREGSTAILRCELCGLMFYVPRPTSDALHGHYCDPVANKYFEPDRWAAAVALSVEASVERERAQLEALWRTHATGLPLGEQPRFLHVACTFTPTLDAAVRAGWQSSCLYLVKPAVEWAADALGVSGRVLPLDGATDFHVDGVFHIVFVSHVLEHHPLPQKLMRALGRLVDPRGIMVVAVPNGRCLPARMDFSAWEWKAYPDHLYYFSDASLRRMAKRAGLDVAASWSIFGDADTKGVREHVRGCLRLDAEPELDTVINALGDARLLPDLRLAATPSRGAPLR